MEYGEGRNTLENPHVSRLSVDIIIVEDDPYYFLQQGPYIKPEERTDEHSSSTSDEEYISQLAPSYLRYLPKYIALTFYADTFIGLTIKAELFD